jgi:hypothetical protein
LVFEPELEIWIWSDSPEVDQAIGWKGHCPPLRTWLTDRGLLQSNSPKPSQPKESLNAALKEVRMHRSSAIYRQLAEKVGLDRCRDKGFMAFQRTMRSWFA